MRSVRASRFTPAPAVCLARGGGGRGRPWLPQAWDWATQTGAAALNGAVTQQEQTIGYINDFTLMVWVALATTPLLPLIRNTKPARER